MDARTLATHARRHGLMGAIEEGTHAGPRDSTGETCHLELLVQGGVATIWRDPFRSEGHARPRVRVAVDPTPADTRRLDAFLRHAATLQRREAAVAGHATAHCPYPAWAFTVDSLALTIAREDGVDLAKCTRPSRWRRTVEPYNGHLASPDDAWDWSRSTNHVDGATASDSGIGAGRIVNVELKGERLVTRLLNPARPDLFLRHEPKGLEVRVNATWPMSTLVGMRGRSVREVIGVDSDHVVTRAQTDDSGSWTILSVKGDRVPLAPPPEGVSIDLGH